MAGQQKIKRGGNKKHAFFVHYLHPSQDPSGSSLSATKSITIQYVPPALVLTATVTANQIRIHIYQNWVSKSSFFEDLSLYMSLPIVSFLLDLTKRCDDSWLAEAEQVVCSLAPCNPRRRRGRFENFRPFFRGL